MMIGDRIDLIRFVSIHNLHIVYIDDFYFILIHCRPACIDFIPEAAVA